MVTYGHGVDLSNTRDRMRVAVEAGVCLPTVVRFAKGGEAAVTRASAAVIRAALAQLEAKKPSGDGK